MIGKQKNIVLAGAIGNALEWYDFTIYAFFVPIISQQFFPNKNQFISLLVTFGVFALGFLVRPIGAVLFGYIGDHAGRKQALILSMIMMSCPTFLIGILPNYEHFGVAAPLLLIVLRMIQGLAVSGELTTATVFLIEHADKDKRGLAGSLAMSGALAGMVISSLFASSITQLLNETQLASWGWRVPFLIGGIIGFFGVLIRLRSVDPTLYIEQEKQTHRHSVAKHVSSLSPRVICTGVLLTSIMAISNYFLIAYFHVFLMEYQGLPAKPVMMINTVVLSIQMLFTLLMGRLSDYIGRKKILGAGIFALIVLVLPIFWLLTRQNLYAAFFGEMLFAMIGGTIAGLIPTTLSEMFDTYHRNTGLSISYNTALAIFGGTTPLIAISLVAYTHQAYAPAFYIMICGTVALLALINFKGRKYL